MRTLATLGLMVLLANALIGCKGTSNSGGASGPSEYVISCENADAGIVTATDETYMRFVEAESARRLTSNSCKSPQLLSPQESIPLRLDAPPTFSFQPTGSMCLMTGQGARPGVLACKTHPKANWGSRAVKSFGDFLVSRAYAHCPAVSGENYYLKIAQSGQSQLIYSAVLSVTSFTPDPSIWRSALRDHTNQTVLLTIERGIFFRGDLIEGPYVQPRAYSFVISP